MADHSRVADTGSKTASAAASAQELTGRAGCRLVLALPFVWMSESLRLTIVYEDAGEGWIMATVPEVPGAISQGRTREEARENVIDALHGILELRFGEHALTEPAGDSEPLELTIAA
jgi:predicted RNase H-like HicB family nuclease